jgi:hypothetical protein
MDVIIKWDEDLREISGESNYVGGHRNYGKAAASAAGSGRM